MINNVLHVKSNLVKSNPNLDVHYALCRVKNETIQHLFQRCTFLHDLWNAWREEVKLLPFKNLDVQNFYFIFLNPLSLIPNKKEYFHFTLAITLTMLTLWRWRNNVIFINEPSHFNKSCIWLRASFFEFISNVNVFA